MASNNDYGAVNDSLREIDLREQPYQDFESTEDAPILGERTVERKKGFCERFCSCCCSSAAPKNAAPSSCCPNLFGFLNFFLVVAAIVYMYVYIRETNARFDSLQSDMVTMQKAADDRYSSLLAQFVTEQKAEETFESKAKAKIAEVESKYQYYSDALKEQERQLIRLSNGTSNADVLDRLRETRDEVRHSLQKEHAEVFGAMQRSARNLSESLDHSKQQLAATQAHVETSLNQTVAYMQTVVGTASVHIKQIQDNVTRDIDDMTDKVHKIVTKLGDNVKVAEDTIRQEVQGVQDKIEQYVIVTNKQFAAENDFVKYQLAGTFTLLGCLISMWHLTSHLRHYYKPDVQRRIMAVLWMVPIYSITSWLSMVFPKFEPFFGAFRDCYEAYAIYTFVALLIAIIEDGRGLSGMVALLAERVVEERDAVIEYERLVAERAPSRGFFSWFGLTDDSAEPLARLPARPAEHIKPPFPCCYQPHRPSTVAAAWLYQCQLMAAQFVILRPFLSVVPLILKFSGTYDIHAVPIFVDGTVNWAAPNFYILFAQNLSVGIAFYGLLSFYHGTEKDLEWCDPWPKFLCIKGVVFATFWQSLTIQMLSTMGRVDERTAVQVQNLLICIEMLLASIAHFYIFPYEEWKEGYKREKEKGIMLKDTLALRDFVKDMTLMVTSWNTGEERPEGESGSIDGLTAEGIDMLDYEVLSVEKAKLTSELHELASRSTIASERSASLGGAHAGFNDLERGLSLGGGEQHSIGERENSWNMFSYDDAYSYLGSHHGHTAEKERERLSLLSHHHQYQGPPSPEHRGGTFESHGLHRDDSLHLGSASQDFAQPFGPPGTSLAARSNGGGRVVRQTSGQGMRLSGDNTEAIKAALLKKLHQLAPISPINQTGTTAPPPRQGLYGSTGVSKLAAVSSSSADELDVAGIKRAVNKKASSTPSFRSVPAEISTSNVGRIDSLTYSPDSSAMELRREMRGNHKPAGGSYSDMAGNVTSLAAVAGELDLTPFDVVDVQSEGESEEEKDDQRGHNPWDDELDGAPHRTPHPHTRGARTGHTVPVDTPFANPDIAYEPPVLTPLLTSLGSGNAEEGGVFHDVLTPARELSPMPGGIQGAFGSAHSLIKHLEDEDSDQSEYAI